MQRVLLLVSGSGGGHIQAGKNLARARSELAPDTTCVLKDSYDFLHPFKRWQYTVGWELLFQYLGPVYHVARGFVVARPWAIQRIRRSFVPSARRFTTWLATQERFDAVVATQPHGAGLMSQAAGALGRYLPGAGLDGFSVLRHVPLAERRPVRCACRRRAGTGPARTPRRSCERNGHPDQRRVRPAA
ncbi:MAG: hypothetical protein U0514_04435 [Candidatus Andersenbacteria bacterium]